MTKRTASAGISQLRQYRGAILEIAARYKAFNVRVYGSVARGEDTSASDIDFLVDFAPDATLLDLIGLEQELSTLLGRQVDVATADGVSPLMRDDPRTTSVSI